MLNVGFFERRTLSENRLAWFLEARGPGLRERIWIDALDAMRELVESPQRWVELTMERGQLQYLDNRRFAHARTPFVDGDTPEQKRHLIRLWNRDEGRRTFHG